MKKYLLYLFLLTTVFTACKKDKIDPPAGERPEERASAAVKAYKDMLVGNTNGWKAYLFPAGGGVNLFSMKFTDNNRVTMLSDINSNSANTSLESSYLLKQQLSPSLIFDTYSYIHLLADPDPSVNGGTAGAGSYSDFEFFVDKVVGDTIKLYGNRLGSALLLVKATSATDYDSFTKGTADVVSKFSQLRTYFKRVTIGGIECEFKFDAKTKVLNFSYLSNGNIVTTSSVFYVDGSTSTIVFLNPLTIGTTKITDIKALTFDAASRVIGGTVNGTAVQFKEAIVPLKYDLTAAATFYNQPSNGSYWSSNDGFTVDNVVDAYKVKSIPNFSFLLFYPKYNAAYSRLGFIANNAYQPYGPAPVASFPANGRIVFTNFGSFGTAPTAIAPVVSATSSKFFDTGGFYAIKTGVNKYDLVSATDARAWISFY